MNENSNLVPGETLIVQPAFTHSNQMHRYEIGEVSKETCWEGV